MGFLTKILKAALRWATYVAAAALIVLGIRMSAHQTVLVLNPKDLIKVDAMVINSDSMGTGVVLRSSSQGTDVITNVHVCEDALSQGSLLVIRGKRYEVRAIKRSNFVDLCLMRIKQDLQIGVRLADSQPEVGDPIMMGGHPIALPLIIQKGYASGLMNFGSPMKPETLFAVGIIVQPGQSGSGVFNEKGELAGVIEALRPEPGQEEGLEIGFGLAVPQKYVRTFVEKESEVLRWTEVPRVGSKP